jgi:GrpB-like predicted nucleotidyltransferase (UPF0157 family)
MDRALSGGRLVITEYDPSWPEAFAQERKLILGAIGERLLAIEHIGSTAVPGLGAKPIIDVLAGLSRLSEADACVPPLADTGYVFVPEAMQYLPDDRYFKRWTATRQVDGLEVAHLHLTEFASTFWRERIRFRDLLRSAPEVAAAYEQLKRDLVRKYSYGPDYSIAKTDFIRSALG